MGGLHCRQNRRRYCCCVAQRRAYYAKAFLVLPAGLFLGDRNLPPAENLASLPLTPCQERAAGFMWYWS